MMGFIRVLAGEAWAWTKVAFASYLILYMGYWIYQALEHWELWSQV